LKYILDTNAASAFMKGHPGVTAAVGEVGRDRIRVPHPVMAELSYGVECLPVSRKRELLSSRLVRFTAEFLRADWSDGITSTFGRIKATLEKRGQRLDDFDLAIAAHALATGAVLVTSNKRQMRRIPGLMIEDWTAPGEGPAVR
jgi:tRNA(fMet)-specific endonuclease VapC